MIRATTPHERPMRRTDLDHSPLLVFYETTRACDLACVHCRACAQRDPHPQELFSADAFRLIDQLTEFPTPPMLALTGGDPLKRQDIFNLVEHAAEAGLTTSISPAATPLASYAALRRLRDTGVSRIAMSLDGATPAAHDAFRGLKGSFTRTLEILSDARSLHLPLQVNTTLHRGNVDQLEALAELLEKQQVAIWSVFFLVPLGRMAPESRLDAEECEAAFARLWREARRRGYAIKTTEAPHYRRYVILHQHPGAWEEGARRGATPRAFSMLGINDGKGMMCVSHTGEIYPSAFLPVRCGTFPLTHLVEAYQNSPIFRALRDADCLEGKCRVCEFRWLCGGSRARAYAVTGNLLAQEPDCAYVPLAWQEEVD